MVLIFFVAFWGRALHKIPENVVKTHQRVPAAINVSTLRVLTSFAITLSL